LTLEIQHILERPVKIAREKHCSLVNFFISDEEKCNVNLTLKMQQILNKPIKIFPGTNTVAYFISL
jgi:hypothetical protein